MEELCWPLIHWVFNSFFFQKMKTSLFKPLIASYGSLARFRQVSRFTSVGDTLIGGSGDLSDFQHIKNALEEAEYVTQTRLFFKK